MSYVPIIIIGALLIGMLLLSQRNRQRAATADAQRRATIGFGTEVMTTSGLYGTVTGVNDEDDTVQLSVAPGVEVKWARAALRDVNAVPNRYRRATNNGGTDNGGINNGGINNGGINNGGPYNGGPYIRGTEQADEPPEDRPRG